MTATADEVTSDGGEGGGDSERVLFEFEMSCTAATTTAETAAG